jgi:hypothetical protein
VVLTKFNDKPLRGLLVGIMIVKILRGESSVPRKIRRHVDAVKIDFLILKNIGREHNINLMWKDLRENKEHFHFFPKKDGIGIGLVITDETKTKSDPEKHIPVDSEKFFGVFGTETIDYFKNRQQILDLTTTKFDKSRIITYNPQVTMDEVRKKTLYLNLEENEKEVTVTELKNTEKALALILDEQGNATDFIVKDMNKIYCYDYEALREMSLDLFPILHENYPKKSV